MGKSNARRQIFRSKAPVKLKRAPSLKRRKMKHDDEQLDIITAPEKSIIIVRANPGSGKSEVIAARLQSIRALGYEDDEFAVTTFTRAASQSMIVKLNNKLGPNDVNVGTFHSLSRKIVGAMTEVLHVDEYLMAAVDMLKGGKSQWAERVKFIFVDEFQDTNELQYELVKRLYGSGKSIMVVGDENQAIYEWRGSDKKYMVKFAREFPNVIQKFLSTNYRSRPEIVDVIRSIMPKGVFIERDNMAAKPPIKAARAKCGFLPRVLNQGNVFAEMATIAQEMKLLVDSGVAPERICALSRARNMLYSLETVLIHKTGIRSNVMDTESSSEVKGRITLATVHSSKGLEWDYVYILGLDGWYFPSSRSSLESELNLFFVAVSRARERLTLCNSTYNPSPFVYDLDAKLVDISSPFNNCPKAPLEQKRQVWIAVTNLLKRIDGKKMLRIKPHIAAIMRSAREQSTGETFAYPNWVKREDLSQEFGIFSEKVAWRMVSEHMGSVEKLEDRFVKACVKSPNWSRAKPSWREALTQSANAYKNPKLSWREILFEVWVVSMAARVSSNRVLVTHLPITLKDLEESMPLFNNMEKTIKTLLSHKPKKVSMGHPIFCRIDSAPLARELRSDGKYSDKPQDKPQDKSEDITVEIRGEADLIYDDVLLDFKNSLSDDHKVEQMMQTLLYAAICRATNHPIATTIVYNMVKGQCITMDLRQWDTDRKFLAQIIS